MSNQKNHNLNITINNPEEDDTPLLTISTLWKKLKKYFLVWVITAGVLLVVAAGYSAITTHTNKTPLTALISFSYSGVEKGLDPNGMKFDVNSIKNPAVIESALTELGYDLNSLETIRSNITFEGSRPKDAIDRLTVYNRVLNESGDIEAAERVLETSYYPTQYTVKFDYNNTIFSDDEAVLVFNEILSNYADYFYEKYGYNENIGSAIKAISYEDYDYAEAIDVFSNSLNTLRRYVNDLATADQTRFRSTATGYTFDDLYSALDTIKTIDLDMISSYITVNNLTKDKEKALAYYEYRIKVLNRDKSELEEEIKAYDSAIENYEKDQVIVFGGAEETNTQTSIASEQYDLMFKQKNNASITLANIKQQINFYKEKQQSLKDSNVSSKKNERVEADLAALNDKINELVEIVYETSQDYYKNVTFRNAYNILVPATSTTSDRVSRLIQNTITPALILEALALMVYLFVSVVQALIADGKKAKMLALANGDVNDDDNDDDDNDDDDDDDKESEVKSDNKQDKSNKK